MKALITGGAGFVGLPLARALTRRGDSVVLLDVALPEGRLADLAGKVEPQIANVAIFSEVLEAFRRHRPDSVFHLAARLSASALASPTEAYHVNFDGFFHTIEAARLFGARRCSYNVQGFSPTAGEIASEVRGRVPGADIVFRPEEERQRVLDSWPRRLEDTPAREDWGWRPSFDMEGTVGAYLRALGGRAAGPWPSVARSFARKVNGGFCHPNSVRMAAKKARPPIGTKAAAEWYWKRYTELYPKYFWADNTKLADIVVVSAKGSLLYDVEGREYIDLTSQWATNNLGNVHPEVLKATQDALERYGFLILFMNPHLPMIDLAERLLEVRPSSNLTRVFLELSGTGAAEGAVKHAIESSGRPLILSFMGQYHGLSIGATAFGTLASRMRRNWEAFSGGAVHTPYPMTYRRPKGMTDDQFGEWCLGFLEDQILRYVASPDRIAGAIFEPVALEAGVWIPPKNFVRGLRKLSDEHGWFFIADEVEAGLGRTGKMWGIEHFGVAPDLVSIGKALGGGMMPLGAVLGDDRSMGKDGVVAGTTFGGHPAACVAATVTIDIMRRDRIPERAARIGGKALRRVKEWEDLSIVGETRGLGLAIGVELVSDKEGKIRDNEIAREVFFDCVRHGVIPLYDYEMNVLRIQPPLTIEEGLLEKGLDVMEDALRKHSR